jgi:DNA-binding response OmpR family regulator
LIIFKFGKGIRMKRRILLVDDEVAVLLTMKAVLEISGFEVDTAASAREGKLRLRAQEYHMIITDMRMESDEAGREVVQAARTAPYQPAVALLTAFPVDEGDWQELGADRLLLKPMHTRILLQQIEQLFDLHERKLAALSSTSTLAATMAPAIRKSAKKKVPAKSGARKIARKPVKAKAKAVKSKPAKKAAKTRKSQSKPISKGNASKTKAKARSKR